MSALAQWLEQIGLGQYAPAFAKEDVSLDILRTLTDRELQELGLSLGHRRVLRSALAKLKANDEVVQPTKNHGRTWSSRAARREPERRQLTLLFCDLVNSTPLSARLDPEDLHELIAAYRQACAAPIERYGGFVGRYVGDGILVYFGYPMAHEDDAERAVRAGLGIIAALSNLNAGAARAAGVELAVRIGIATGFVVVGDLADDGAAGDMVIGQAPNLAARLQDLAQPNTVVISLATKQLLAERFEYRDLGKKALKGIDEPVVVWQVVAERMATRFEARGQDPHPLVNRGEELNTLLRCWKEAEAGKGQFVILRGEAGIGKSRLVTAICERAQQQARAAGVDGPTVLHFQCSPYHTNTALYPITRQIEQRAGIDRKTVRSDQLASLKTFFASAGVGVDDGNTLSLLADLFALGAGGNTSDYAASPQLKRERTLEVLANWCRSFALSGCAIFVFEDVQWIDPTSKIFLRQLIEMGEAARALIVATLRTDRFAEHGGGTQLEFSAPLESSGQITPCDLRELREGETRQLVAAVAGSKTVPPRFVDAILQKAEGIPLYIEELTRGLIGGEPLELEHDAIEPLPALTIPRSLRDPLMSRLDQMGRAKEVAQQAAVVGQEFSLELLLQVSTLPRERVLDGLAALIASGLILPSQGSAVAGYHFKHALIQNVAYRSLLKRRRKEIHLRIAGELEKQQREHANITSDLIAQHYWNGGGLRKAIATWKFAAEQAIARSAQVEAVNLLQHAISSLRELDDDAERLRTELDLTIELATALRSIHGYAAPVAEVQYTRARELCIRAGESGRRFNIEWGLMQCNFVKGDMIATRAIAESLFEHAKNDPDRPFADAHLANGMVKYQTGEFLGARELFEKGSALTRPDIDEPRFFTHGQNPGTFCYSFLARTLWFLGYPDQAKSMINKNLVIARARAREASHLHSYCNALACAMVISQYRRETEAVKQYAEELFGVSHRNRYTYYEALAVTHEGWVLGEEHPRVGIEQMRRGLAAFEQTGTVNLLPVFCARLAELYASLDDRDRALEALDEAVRRNERGTRIWDAEIERVRGDVLSFTSAFDHGPAEAAFQLCLAIARRQNARSLELRGATSYARMLRKCGRSEQAHDMIEACLAGFDEGWETRDLKYAVSLKAELRGG